MQQRKLSFRTHCQNQREESELEQYSRRNCLVFTGIPENENENTDKSIIDIAKDVMKVDRVGLAQLVACPPLARQVVSSPLGRVIPKTIIKMVQTASLHRHACVRVGV